MATERRLSSRHDVHRSAHLAPLAGMCQPYRSTVLAPVGALPDVPECATTTTNDGSRGSRTVTASAPTPEERPPAGVGGHFRRPVAPRVLGQLAADLGYEPIADSLAVWSCRARVVLAGVACPPSAPWGWLRDGAARAFGDTRSYAVPPRTRRSGARMQLPNARTLALASATDLHLGAV
jgi:hypothetical protein